MALGAMWSVFGGGVTCALRMAAEGSGDGTLARLFGG